MAASGFSFQIKDSCTKLANDIVMSTVLLTLAVNQQGEHINSLENITLARYNLSAVIIIPRSLAAFFSEAH